MLCMECGAEMHLVQVAKANTISVSGFEHRTWQCSGCSAVEQRMAFSREKTPTQTEPIELARTGSVQGIQTALAGKVQAEPTDPRQPDRIASPESVSVQPAAPTQAAQTKPAGPAQTDRAKATATVPVKSTLTATVEPAQTIHRTYPEAPAAMAQIERAKALEEKVRNLKERVTAARKVAGDTKQHTQWDNEFRSVPPPSGPSNTSSHIKPDEPLQSPTEPISDNKPVAPVSNTLAPPKLRKTLGGLVRAIAPKGLSRVR